MYASGADIASPRTHLSEAITVILCPLERAGIFIALERLVSYFQTVARD